MAATDVRGFFWFSIEFGLTAENPKKSAEGFQPEEVCELLLAKLSGSTVFDVRRILLESYRHGTQTLDPKSVEARFDFRQLDGGFELQGEGFSFRMLDGVTFIDEYIAPYRGADGKYSEFLPLGATAEDSVLVLEWTVDPEQASESFEAGMNELLEFTRGLRVVDGTTEAAIVVPSRHEGAARLQSPAYLLCTPSSRELTNWYGEPEAFLSSADHREDWYQDSFGDTRFLVWRTA